MNTSLFTMFFCITFLYPLTCNAQPKQQKPAHILHMNQAVQLALKHRPSLQALQYELAAKRLDEKQAWYGYLPTAVFISEATQRRKQNFPRIDTRIEAEQLIYDPAGPQLQAQKAKKETDALYFQQQRQRHVVQFAVENRYLKCWRLQQQYQSIILLHRATKVNVKKTHHQHDTQLINKHQWLSNLEKHASSLSSIQQYYDALTNTAKQLMFLIGNSQVISLLPMQGIFFTKLICPYKKIERKNLAHYQQLTQRHRPEIKEAQRNIEIAQYAYSLAAHSHLPRLSAIGAAGHVGGGDFGKHGHHTIGAKLEWNLLDRARSSIQASQAHAQKLAAQLNKQEVIQKINAEVEGAYYTLSQEQSKLKARYFKYLRAKNEFFLRQKEFDVGTLASVNFEQAKATWQAASFDWIAQKATVGKKYQNLLFRCGYPA